MTVLSTDPREDDEDVRPEDARWKGDREEDELAENRVQGLDMT